MNEFDDPQLENILGRLGGAYPDANVAYTQVRGRVRQAKRRRALVASATACVVLGGLAVIGVQGGGSAGIAPADSPDVSVSVDGTDATDTSVDDTAVDATGDSSVDTSVDDTADTMVDTSVDSSNSGSGSTNSGHGSSTTSSTHTTSPATPDGLSSHSSEGGSLTVLVQNATLVFVSAQPTTGYTENVGARVLESTRVRVEFDTDGSRWRIEAELKDGVLGWTVQHDGQG